MAGDSPSTTTRVVVEHPALGGLLLILLLYLFFRHFMLVLMFMDVMLGFMRQFSWFPGEGKRTQTVKHWLIAIILLIGCVALLRATGLLSFVPGAN